MREGPGKDVREMGANMGTQSRGGRDAGAAGQRRRERGEAGSGAPGPDGGLLAATGFRGTALHRGFDDDVRHPPTAAPGKTGRDIVRFLEGTDGEALFVEIAAQLPEVERAEVERAVNALREAGIVSVDPGYGEPRVRLESPIADALEEG